MKVHHLNLLSMCPMLGPWLSPFRMVTHCLVVETEKGLVVVDTGVSRLDLEDRSRLGRLFHAVIAPDPTSQPLIEQIRALGLSERDVRSILLTHLDLDHAGGLQDFPDAEVHLLSDELQAAMAQRSLPDRTRYKPVQWGHSPKWVKHERTSAQTWKNFEGVLPLDRLGAPIVLVPMIGHTDGHCGIAIEETPGQWILHAGDAYYDRSEIDDRPLQGTARILHLFGTNMAAQRHKWKENQERLRTLVASEPSVRVISSHDASEFD